MSVEAATQPSPTPATDDRAAAAMSIRDEIKTFILNNYLFTSDPAALADGDSLMGKGVVDSTGILELIMHLEENYGLTVADQEMIPENLDSVSAIAAFVERKRNV